MEAKWRESHPATQTRNAHPSAVSRKRFGKRATEAFGPGSSASDAAQIELNKSITSGVSTIPTSSWRGRYARLANVGALATLTIATFLAHHNAVGMDESQVAFSSGDLQTGGGKYNYGKPHLNASPVRSRSTSLAWASANRETISIQGSAKVFRSGRSVFGHNIVAVDLRGLHLSDSDFAKLVPALMEDLYIRRVYFGDNLLTDAGLDALVEQFKDGECHSGIEVLSLPHNCITLHGVINLFTHISKLPSLSRLDISAVPSPFEMSPLLERHVKDMGSAIAKTTSLSEIVFRGAGAPAEMCEILVDATNTRSMAVTSLSSCPVQDAILCQVLHQCVALRTFGCVGVVLSPLPHDAFAMATRQSQLSAVAAKPSGTGLETRLTSPSSRESVAWAPSPMHLSLPQQGKRVSGKWEEPVPLVSEENSISNVSLSVSDRDRGSSPLNDHRNPAVGGGTSCSTSEPSSRHPLVVLHEVLIAPARCLDTVILRTPLSLDAVELLARGLEGSRCLQKLILSHCELTAPAFRLIGLALQNNHTLRYLDLSYPHPSLADPDGVAWERHTAYEFSHMSQEHSESGMGDDEPDDLRGSAIHQNQYEDYCRYYASGAAVIAVQPHKPLHALIAALSHPLSAVEELVLMGVGMDVNDVEGLCETIEVHGNKSLIHVGFSFTSSEALLLKLSTLIMRNRLRLQRRENADDYVASSRPR